MSQEQARRQGGRSRVNHWVLVREEGGLFSGEKRTIWERSRGEAPAFPHDTTLLKPAGACEGGVAALRPAPAGGGDLRG